MTPAEMADALISAEVSGALSQSITRVEAYQRSRSLAAGWFREPKPADLPGLVQQLNTMANASARTFNEQWASLSRFCVDHGVELEDWLHRGGHAGVLEQRLVYRDELLAAEVQARPGEVDRWYLIWTDRWRAIHRSVLA